MSDSKARLVVVTGASSGIGLAMTQRLLQEGYSVLGIGRDFSRNPIEHENFRGEILDLADSDKLPEKISALVKTIDQPIRALVNNAGIGKMGFLEQLSVADIKLTMDINFLAHAIVSKAFVPVLKTQAELADIVFIGSEAALQGARQGSIYCASKFAIRGFSQALREECSKSGVRVSLINPGAVRTPFFDELHFEPGQEAENAIAPDDVAAALISVPEARPGTVVDEINLSPMTSVWQRKG